MNTPVCFSIPLLMDTWLLYILEIMKKAAMNKPFCEHIFLFFLGKNLRMELLGSIPGRCGRKLWGSFGFHYDSGGTIGIHSAEDKCAYILQYMSQSHTAFKCPTSTFRSRTKFLFTYGQKQFLYCFSILNMQNFPGLLLLGTLKKISSFLSKTLPRGFHHFRW